MVRYLNTVNLSMFTFGLLFGILLNLRMKIVVRKYEPPHLETNNDHIRKEGLQASVHNVPNVVHYIWFGQNKTFRFHHMLSVLSASRFLKPDTIFLHGDAEPFGPLWKHTTVMVPNIERRLLWPKSEIFGNPIKEVEYMSDVARLEILLKHGGMYLDADVFILKSFNPLRKYMFTLGQGLREPDPALNNGIILSVAGHKFLQMWYDSYRSFNHTQWIRHSCKVPYRLSLKFPDLIHIEEFSLNFPDMTRTYLIYNENYDWRNNYAMHTFYRCQGNLEHTPESIKRLNSTFGQMSRLIYYGSPEMI